MSNKKTRQFYQIGTNFDTRLSIFSHTNEINDDYWRDNEVKYGLKLNLTEQFR